METEFLKFMTYFVLVVHPISVAFLALLVVHYRTQFRVGIFARSFICLIAVGLTWSAVEHMYLLENWKAPRARGWLPTILGLNLTIWAVFFRTAFNRKKGISYGSF